MESKKSFDNKQYWKDVGDHYLTQIPIHLYKEWDKHFKNILTSELDINKIETVLEVGCGFGRVSKILLELLPNIRCLTGIDLSNKMIKQSRDYCKEWYDRGIFFPWVVDFEGNTHFMDIRIDKTRPLLYDLVIAVEVMTSIDNTPAGELRVKQFIDKMVSMSKKYVINVDWFDAPTIEGMTKVKAVLPINHFHRYDKYYTDNRKVIQCKGFGIPRYSEHCFVVRVK